MYQKQADSLPITTYEVSLDTPCMDPMAIPSQELTFPEHNTYEICPKDKSTGKLHDPRYKLHYDTRDTPSFNLGEWAV